MWVAGDLFLNSHAVKPTNQLGMFPNLCTIVNPNPIPESVLIIVSAISHGCLTVPDQSIQTLAEQPVRQLKNFNVPGNRRSADLISNGRMVGNVDPIFFLSNCFKKNL